MNRIGFMVLLALALNGGPAVAGDGAALNVLGFSADGRYFAFEQYGEGDGAGSYYSSITAMEVAGDRPVKGTPVTTVMDPDNPELAKELVAQRLAFVRARTTADADALFGQFGISLQPGVMMASAPESQARTVVYGEGVKPLRQAAVGAIELPAARFGQGARLALRQIDVALPRCKDRVAGDHPQGFELTLERKGRPTIHLRRDQAIPTANGCPEHYGIAEVHAVDLQDGSTALAVVLQYFYMGFEGLDRRFIVVTGRLS